MYLEKSGKKLLSRETLKSNKEKKMVGFNPTHVSKS